MIDTFKLQPTENLISRLYILEFMREIGPKKLYDKAEEAQRKVFFYRFYSEDNSIEEVDINWEYCLFVASLPQLEYLMGNFIEEVEEIEEKRKEAMDKLKGAALNQDKGAASISVYDLAKTSLEGFKKGELVDEKGFKL